MQESNDTRPKVFDMKDIKKTLKAVHRQRGAYSASPVMLGMGAESKMFFNHLKMTHLIELISVYFAVRQTFRTGTDLKLEHISTPDSSDKKLILLHRLRELLVCFNQCLCYCVFCASEQSLSNTNVTQTQ